MTDTSREALIKRLRTETWSGFQSMAEQAADMLEADADLRTQLARRTVERDMVIRMAAEGSEIYGNEAQQVDALLEARAQEPELLDPSIHHKLTQLSDDQIDLMLAATPRKFGTGRPDYRHFARAIEKHHGIGAKPVTKPDSRPQNCGTGHCSCIECPYQKTDWSAA